MKPEKSWQQEVPSMGRIRHIHFVGIGGAGMSGIAEVLLHQGYHISGSDLRESAATKALQANGATINFGHDKKNIKLADVVVQSSAISDDNPEIAAARNARIPVVPRAQMLAELMRFRYGIAVSGTHGKTTTTSLVTCILAEGGLDPSFVIGGKLNSAGSNASLGQSQYLVAEADESDASFLHLQPMMTIVTNIDADHMQTYQGDFKVLNDTFLKFLHHLPFYGLAVLCLDDPVLKKLLPKISRPMLTYGFDKQADVQAIKFKAKGMESLFTVKRYGDHADLSIQLNLPGRHNVLNALAAIAVATELGVDDKAICAALKKFEGIGRRMQQYGEIKTAQGEVTLIDDYGHHPREITATLEALREALPDRRIVMIFQPHRYSRTQELFDDFSHALSLTDILLMLPVFAAGEEIISGADSRSLCRSIRQRGSVEPIFVADEKDLPKAVKNVFKAGDVIITQGAGSIGRIPAFLKDALEK